MKKNILYFFICNIFILHSESLVFAQQLSDELRIDETTSTIQDSINNDDRDMIEAADLMAKGSFSEASAIYEKLYQRTKDAHFLKQMALAHAQSGNLNKAVTYAREYQELSKNSDDSETNLIIAEDHIRKQEYNFAIILLERISQNDPTLQTHYILANLYIKQSALDKALPHFIAIYNDEMSAGTKFKFEALNQIISIYLQNQDIDNALSYLNEYIANNEYEINIQNFLALYMKTNKLDILEQNLLKRFDEVQSIENVQMLVAVLVQQNKHAEVIKILKNNEALLGHEGNEILMRVYADNKQFNEAMQVAKKIYDETGQIDYLGFSAIYQYETIGVKNKTTLKPVIDTIKIVLETQTQNLKQQNQKIGENEAFFYNFLGYILIDYEININEGLQYIGLALSVTPNSPEYLDSLAWGLYKKGDCKEAQETFNLISAQEIQSMQELQEHDALIKNCTIKQ